MVVMDRPALARANAGAPGVDDDLRADRGVEPGGVAVCHMRNYRPDAERAQARRTGLNRKVAITLWQLPGHAGGGIIHSW